MAESSDCRWDLNVRSWQKCHGSILLDFLWSVLKGITVWEKSKTFVIIIWLLCFPQIHQCVEKLLVRQWFEFSQVSSDRWSSESCREQHTNIKLYVVVCFSFYAAAGHCPVYCVCVCVCARARVCMCVCAPACVCVFDHCHYQLLA